jgi:hypothetical protein
MDSRLHGSDPTAYGHSRASGNPSSGVLESLPELLKQLLRVSETLRVLVYPKKLLKIVVQKQGTLVN